MKDNLVTKDYMLKYSNKINEEISSIRDSIGSAFSGSDNKENIKNQIIEKLFELSNKYPNDYDLGREIRNLITELQ